MALPSGYTKLDYIESSGTQYINTGFKPNQNTRCVIDIENLSSAQAAFFGARASQTAASFTYFSLTATTGRSDYGSSKQSMTFTNTVGRYTVDQNKNVCTANGVTATGTANTFQLTNNLYLMAVNQADAAIQNAKLKLYSAKVYDNGTLIRDFIPCKNASGTIGLWDNVNSVFYANAGTGTFSTGTKHKTLIDGTGYEIKSGRVLIAGTGYDIKKGRTLIGGTGYDIKFGTPVAELAEGTIIKINESGSPVEFYIAKHDYESDLNGAGRTLVVRKKSYGIVNDLCGKSFFTGSVYTLLNNTYFNLLDEYIQSVIGTTKFKYTRKPNDYSAESINVVTGESAIFLLSATELDETYLEGKEDGTALPTANILKIAYYNEAANKQLTRTRSQASPGHLLHFTAAGALDLTIYEDVPYRPVFTLPETAEVDSDFNIIPA